MKRLLMVLLLLGLNGCALWNKPVVTVARPAQAQHAAFALDGRVAVNQQGKHHSANLRWNHKASSDEILLLTPLGQVAARIYRDARQAILDDGKKRYQAEDAESLMQQVLGWQLPVDDLHHWVLGMPSDAQWDKLERNENGQISVLQQNGWQVRYLAYADESRDSLPVRMALQHDDLQIKLLIDTWEWP